MRHSSHFRLRPESATPVLVAISEPDVRQALLSALAGSKWRLRIVAGPEEAANFLRTDIAAVVIVSYRSEGQQSWRSLIEQTRRLPAPPSIVVTDHAADEFMWAEVLNLGAYDLLPQPFVEREATYLLSAAWRFWKENARLSAPAGIVTYAA